MKALQEAQHVASCVTVRTESKPQLSISFQESPKHSQPTTDHKNGNLIFFNDMP